eukprot:9196714-Pyramimonas_sp.AAC.1
MPEIDVEEHLDVARAHLDPCGGLPVPRRAAVLLEDVVAVPFVAGNAGWALRLLENLWRERRPPVAEHGVWAC